jgi:hypothetical protein
VTNLTCNGPNTVAHLAALKSFSYYSKDIYQSFVVQVIEFVKSVLLQNIEDLDDNDPDWRPYNCKDLSNKGKVKFLSNIGKMKVQYFLYTDS